jgi:hypothetical protein
VIWILVEVILLLVAGGWVLRWRRRQETKSESVITDFGLIFSILTFFSSVQAYHYSIFDRYYEPALVGCLIWLSGGKRSLGNSRRVVKFVFAGLILVFAGFSVGGVHDLFAWNHARWSLFQRAVSRGVPISDLDGGYEINGWFAFEEGRPNSSSPGCGLVQPWYCGNRSHKIVMDPNGGGVVEDSEPVQAWIGTYPDLKLLRISR